MASIGNAYSGVAALYAQERDAHNRHNPSPQQEAESVVPSVWHSGRVPCAGDPLTIPAFMRRPPDGFCPRPKTPKVR